MKEGNDSSGGLSPTYACALDRCNLSAREWVRPPLPCPSRGEVDVVEQAGLSPSSTL